MLVYENPVTPGLANILRARLNIYVVKFYCVQYQNWGQYSGQPVIE